jgi:hypothetical protein
MSAGALVVVLTLGACGNSPEAAHLAHVTPISTSPADEANGDAALRFTLAFDSNGCPTSGEQNGSLVWPHGYSAGTDADGEHVVVTTDGTEIRAGDIVMAGGGLGTAAPTGMPCVTTGTTPTYVDGDVSIIPRK